MRSAFGVWVPLCALTGVLAFSLPARAYVSLGAGNASLIGGDLTSPDDKVAPSDVDPGSGKSEEQMLPRNAGWVKLKAAPITSPYGVPYQIHPYQSWVSAPAASILMNNPEQKKWYVSFKEGGYGGPSREDPYYLAVQFAQAYVLTHFTVTAGGPDAPDRDPKEWAIQGSNTGEDDDWTDIYVCNAKDRAGSPFKEAARCETNRFTSFDSPGLDKALAPAEANKLSARLGGKAIAKADFARPVKAYTWFRIAIYSCFNPSAVNWIYRDSSNAFALGQLELFGVPGAMEKVAPKVVKEEPVTGPPLDAPFIISYWCGPSKQQTDLKRMQEVAECGFTVAQAPDLWEKHDDDQVAFNKKFLDLCQQAGIKAFIYDGNICTSGHWEKFAPADIPGIEKDLDGMIANYSSHPGLMGFVLGDEMGVDAHPRLGFVTQYLLKKDPTHVPYYNLLPNYASGNPKSYEWKVADYLKVVKPVLFSWDAYWQMFGRGGDEHYYWENLEIVRRNCVKAKVPFNQIIVSLAHMGYRECSEGDLRWQVWTSLAYGSRGIQYFTYVHVPVMATGEAPGLLDKYGNRDRKYGYVQTINRRIAKLGPTPTRSRSARPPCWARPRSRRARAA
ncbi:MAG: hypothetical protein NT031_08795 [Planctomycetota bacterium]|nr:hypothetical protein [Planctomycetota bacterium]